MNDNVFTIADIKALVKPIAEKYNVDETYLFGSYARNEADQNSDLDQINEINRDSEFYKTIMKERLRVA